MMKRTGGKKRLLKRATTLILGLVLGISAFMQPVATYKVSAASEDGSYGYYDDEDDDDTRPDVSKAVISPKASAYPVYYSEYGQNYTEITLKINGVNGQISSEDISFDYPDDWGWYFPQASFEDVSVNSQNVLKFKAYGYAPGTFKIKGILTGKDDVEKTFTIKIASRYLTMPDGIVMVKGKTKQLKVKANGKDRNLDIKWSSSNKKVATVSSKGKVKGKKIGNAIIYARIGKNIKLGCVAAITSSKKLKAVNRVKKIASTCKYSQAKRMSSKYYDCSSLVWKGYKAAGIYIGSRSYAPTAAEQARYFSKKGKLKKYNYKNEAKLKYQVGDICYRSGKKNGRFKNIYHAEMVTDIRYSPYGCYCDGANGGVIGGAPAWMARP